MPDPKIRKEGRNMWFGIVIMVLLVVGLVGWMAWAMKKDKERSD